MNLTSDYNVFPYDVLIIWESDYKNNKNEIKNKCIKWIKNL